jgi:transcription termination factor NusB
MARTGSKGVRRRASRLAAVQALYQMEIANKSVARWQLLIFETGG